MTKARSASADRALSFRVSNGTRTRDILDHNQVLYQLSYTHHDRLCTGREKVYTF